MDVPITPPPTMTTSAVVIAGLRVHRCAPLRMRPRASADGLEVRLADLHGQRAHRAVADGMPVDGEYRCDLRRGAGEERFFRDVQLGTIDRSFLDFDAERFA